MGTRSLTIFYNTWKTPDGEEKSAPLCAFYRQMDGYLSGHGADLRENFGDFSLINGIGLGVDLSKKANGMGCFAAQVIAHFKNKHGIGGIYMSHVENYQEYNYHIYEKDRQIWVKVKGWDNKGGIIYEGWLANLPED